MAKRRDEGGTRAPARLWLGQETTSPSMHCFALIRSTPPPAELSTPRANPPPLLPRCILGLVVFELALQLYCLLALCTESTLFPSSPLGVQAASHRSLHLRE